MYPMMCAMAYILTGPCSCEETGITQAMPSQSGLRTLQMVVDTRCKFYSRK